MLILSEDLIVFLFLEHKFFFFGIDIKEKTIDGSNDSSSDEIDYSNLTNYMKLWKKMQGYVPCKMMKNQIKFMGTLHLFEIPIV